MSLKRIDASYEVDISRPNDATCMRRDVAAMLTSLARAPAQNPIKAARGHLIRRSGSHKAQA